MDVFFDQYFDLSVMKDAFPDVLHAFWVTLKLTFFGATFAMLAGVCLAILRKLPAKRGAPVRVLAIAYTDAMRGIPLLLVLLLVSGSIPYLTFLPEWMRRPEFLGEEDIFWFGVLSLTLVYGAYYGEVFRAGIEAVPRGQTEAAEVLGMGHAQKLRHVILPQAFRTVIPPLVNDLTALLKDTSLVQVIGVVEVVQVGRQVQAEQFNSSALILGALFFLAVTLPLARIADRHIKRQQVRFERA
jgi:polar amino acid transport system permease protein